MHENPGSDAVDLHAGSPEASPAPDPWFEGFGAPGRPDSRVSSLAGAAGGSGARYKAMSPAHLPITRSPCLTIPPGFSPSALLESPVLLTNIKAEPSPTTGTFFMPVIMNNAVGPDTLSSSRDLSNNSACDKGGSGDFEFKPHMWPSSGSGLSSLGPLASVGSMQQEYEPSVQIQTQAVESSQLVKAEAVAPAEVAIDESQLSRDLGNSMQAVQSDHNGSTSLAVVEKSSEDGYNWRKYGQKHVKGSEFPRSYYKCTHPNCEMKKHLERSHDGQITEIIYKGRHDHPKPQPNRRLAVGTILSSQGEEKFDGFSSLISAADKSSSVHVNGSHQIDPNGNQELSPISASDDDAEVGGGQSNNMGDDDDDPESKRRRKDGISVDVAPIGKLNREPRVVVQTISEVDILDDGYRWRKYGQKVVKGNPNPRSYYKCTNAGCPVRKHVERASHDPKAVITTYEGKHDHDVPAARTTSHDTSASTMKDGTHALNSRMSVALSGLLRTCDAAASSNHYAQPTDSDTISLDLGVGISPNHSSTSNEPQHAAPESELVPDHQIQFPGSDYNEVVIQAIPISSIYGNSNNGIYGSREDKKEGFSFKPQPINRSPSLYYSNTGNMVMSP